MLGVCLPSIPSSPFCFFTSAAFLPEPSPSSGCQRFSGESSGCQQFSDEQKRCPCSHPGPIEELTFEHFASFTYMRVSHACLCPVDGSLWGFGPVTLSSVALLEHLVRRGALIVWWSYGHIGARVMPPQLCPPWPQLLCWCAGFGGTTFFSSEFPGRFFSGHRFFQHLH